MKLTSDSQQRPPACISGQFPPAVPALTTVPALPDYLFLGTLSIVETTRGPWLCITHRCNHCSGRRGGGVRGLHHHTWSVDAPAGIAQHRACHCWRPGSPYEVPVGYWILPRPECNENARVLLAFRELVSSPEKLKYSRAGVRREKIEYADCVIDRDEWPAS
jgi:hypothetical protein